MVHTLLRTCNSAVWLGLVRLAHLGSDMYWLVIVVTQEGAIQDLDAYYEKLGNFTGIYARHAFDRMAKTVPKAIILCQVRAA